MSNYERRSVDAVEGAGGVKGPQSLGEMQNTPEYQQRLAEAQAMAAAEEGSKVSNTSVTANQKSANQDSGDQASSRNNSNGQDTMQLTGEDQTAENMQVNREATEVDPNSIRELQQRRSEQLEQMAAQGVGTILRKLR